MAREHRHQRRANPGRARLLLSITPMIDVVFLLLIYFLLTTGFASTERLLRAEGTREQADGTREQAAREIDAKNDRAHEEALALEADPLVIELARVNGATRITLSGGLAQPSDTAAQDGTAQLERILRDALLTRDRPQGLFEADHPIRIAPARDVPWEDVVGAFNAVVRAGYRAVAVGGGS